MTNYYIKICKKFLEIFKTGKVHVITAILIILNGQFDTDLIPQNPLPNFIHSLEETEASSTNPKITFFF